MPRPRKEESSGFAERLKYLREARELTQDELAHRAGLNRFSIAKLEQGHREPNWPTVLRLAKALGVKVGAFAAGGGEAEARTANGLHGSRRTLEAGTAARRHRRA